jgi:hypothetical protein
MSNVKVQRKSKVQISNILEFDIPLTFGLWHWGFVFYAFLYNECHCDSIPSLRGVG